MPTMELIIMDLSLSPDVGRTLTEPGDFQVAVTNDKLLLPEDLYRILQRQNLETLEEFISYMYSFPKSLAALLKWTSSEVLSARENLVRELQGYITKKPSTPSHSFKRSYGALQPDWDDNDA